MCGRFYVEPEDEYFRELDRRIESSPLLEHFHGNEQDSAPHPKQKLFVTLSSEVCCEKYDLLRVKAEQDQEG